MKRTALALAAAGLMVATSAQAGNELVLLAPDSFFNTAHVAFEGDGNRLEILQENPTGGAANTVRVSISGDLNGGAEGARFASSLDDLGLSPGTLRQSGFGNGMTIDVEGTSNLFAFAQIGSGNTLHASIQGHENQAAVMQVGVNNFASFSQNGIGNSVSISQTSW